MDDDGLLLNFTTSAKPAALSSKKLAALQGKKPKGSWRDRREASRAAATSARDVPLPTYTRPDRKASDSSNRAKRSSHGGVSKALNSAKKDSDPPKDGIISSLFSFNPHIQPGLSHNGEEHNGEITNAPLQESNGFAVCPALKTFLETKMNLSSPTQIQKVAIPAITDAARNQKDVVMVAQTGSGKTLAYLLPILNELMTSSERIDRTSGIYAVILAPTRELASQIYQVCEDLCRCCHYIVPGLVIGGEKKKSEKARLRKGVNILIGTPGRMADHVDNTMRLSFKKTKYAILDEGDRLIDLGFEETLTQILAAIPQQRTTILCSATMNAQASRLKTLALSDPITWARQSSETDVKGGQNHHAENTPGQLLQRVSVVPGKLRLVTLAAVTKYIFARSKRAIIFFSCTDSVDFHHEVFFKRGNNVFKLHGNMTQQQRSETIAQFSDPKNEGKGSILLTTDVASRGLDVTVDEVVEYDPPFTIEDHLHRAGRTARAGKKGEALMFLLPTEQAYEAKLREAHSGGLRTETYQALLQRGFGFTDWQDAATVWQLDIEKKIVANIDGIADLARKAFTAHIRAYTTHSHSEKSIFNFREMHLGHMAKAFGLREAPGSISSGGQSSSSDSKKHKKKAPRQAMLEAAQRQLEMDEYNVI